VLFAQNLQLAVVLCLQFIVFLGKNQAIEGRVTRLNRYLAITNREIFVFGLDGFSGHVEFGVGRVVMAFGFF
jgi:hypothetical protein